MTMEYSGRGDPKRSMELLWRTKEPPSRGPKPSLTIERIVQVAIEVADAEGLAALSMRSVAVRLGVTTMALYRYVPGKAELLDVMLDTVIGEATKAYRDEDGWREKLKLIAREDWALYHRHPWVLQVAMPRPPLGPNVLGGYNAALRAVSGIGLTAKEMMAVVELMADYVQGAARNSVNALEATRHTGVTDEQWWEAHASLMEYIIDFGRYPTLSAITEAGGFDDYDSQNRGLANFEFGLQRVLDGIEAFVRTRVPGLKDSPSEH